ncbi:MAG: MMPL family transporter [Thermoplasmata archaeon]
MLEKQFGALGKFIKKRYKIIIALWLIALIIFLPFALKSSSVTNYNVEMTGVSKNSMATEAQNIMNKEFATRNGTGNGTVVVLFFSSPFYSQRSYEIWKYINSTYQTLSSVGLENATSPYPIAIRVMNSIGNATYLVFGEVYRASNETRTAFITYNSSLNAMENATLQLKALDMAYLFAMKNVTEGVSSYSKLFEGYKLALVNASSLIYGVPIQFVQVFTAVSSQYPNLQPEEWNYISYQRLMKETGNLGNSSTAISYFNLFYYEWNSTTASQPSLPPTQRLNQSIGYAFQSFSVYLNNSEKEVFGAVYDALSTSSYLNSSLRNKEINDALYNVTRQFASGNPEIFNATYLNFIDGGNETALAENLTGEIIQSEEPSVSLLTESLFNVTPVQFSRYFYNVSGIDYGFLYSQLKSSKLSVSIASLSNSFNIPESTVYSSLLNNTISSLEPYFVNFSAEKMQSLSSVVGENSSYMTGYFISHSPYASSMLFTRSFLEKRFAGYPYFNFTDPGQFVNVSNASKGEVASYLSGNFSATGMRFNASLFSTLVPENMSGFIVLLSFKTSSLNSSQLGTLNSYIQEVHSNFKDVPLYYTSADEIAHGIEKTAYSGLIFSLIIGIIVSIFIVGIYFRSIIFAFIPLLFFGVSFGITLGITYVVFGIFLKSSLSFIVTTLSSILILGLSTDYSVYMLNRYLKEQSDDKLGSTMEWAGHAVFTSGLTVIISYTVLALFNIPIIGDGGFVNALGITISLGVALTLLPSFIHLFGNRIKEKRSKVSFRKLAKVSMRHRKALVAALVVLFVGALVVYEVTPTSFDLFSLVPNNEGKMGYYDMVSAYGGDRLSPTFVILSFASPLYSNGTFNASEMSILGKVTSSLLNDSSVSGIETVNYPFGYKLNPDSIPGSELAVNATINQSLSFIGKDSRTVLIYVYVKYVSYTQQGIDAVNHIDSIMRSTVPQGVKYYVGGAAQDLIDSSQSITLSTYRIVEILGTIIFVVLALQLTSVFTPLRLLFNVGTSALVAVSLFYLLFYYIEHLPIIVFGPLFVIVTLFGVGLDYDIFLVTRAREAVMKGKSDEEAIEEAIEENASVVLALGFILAGVFGSLIFSPIGIISEVGFSITVGVLIDTLVSWLFLIPALMLVLKKYNWWPSRISVQK